MIIRFPPRANLLGQPKPKLWTRIKRWLAPPKKAPVFKIKNPTHWKLERIRRRAREAV